MRWEKIAEELHERAKDRTKRLLAVHALVDGNGGEARLEDVTEASRVAIAVLLDVVGELGVPPPRPRRRKKAKARRR